MGSVTILGTSDYGACFRSYKKMRRDRGDKKSTKVCTNY